MTKPGVYLHKKGNKYRVLFTAMEATNGRERKPVVVYVSLKDGSVNVRDEVEFNELERNPDCTFHRQPLHSYDLCTCPPRFKLIEEA